MKIEVDTKEELEALKNKALKTRIIALSKMNKDPSLNVSYLSKKDRNELLELMKNYFEKSDEEINNSFNSIVNNEILCNGKDISNYPVYYTENQKSIIDNDNDEIVKKYSINK